MASLVAAVGLTHMLKRRKFVPPLLDTLQHPAVPNHAVLATRDGVFDGYGVLVSYYDERSVWASVGHHAECSNLSTRETRQPWAHQVKSQKNMQDGAREKKNSAPGTS